jgi:predicted nucleic acid-binding protein
VTSITVQKASGDHLVQQANRGFHQTAFRTTDYAGREPVPFDHQYGAASQPHAAGSATGASALVVETCHRGLTRAVSSRTVLLEAERNIRNELGNNPLLRFYEALGLVDLEIVPDPTSREIEAQTRIIHAKDAYVLAAASGAGVDFLLTLDRKHFMTRAVLQAGLSFKILTPGDFLGRLVGGSEERPRRRTSSRPSRYLPIDVRRPALQDVNDGVSIEKMEHQSRGGNSAGTSPIVSGKSSGK